MSLVRYERRGRVALVTINRPEVRNCVDRETADPASAVVDNGATLLAVVAAVLGVWVAKDEEGAEDIRGERRGRRRAACAS